MTQYRISAGRNNSEAKTFGELAMSICVADKYVLALKKAGTGRDISAWNPSFRQSLKIPIRS